MVGDRKTIEIKRDVFEYIKKGYEGQIFCGLITHSHNNNQGNWREKRSEKLSQIFTGEE